MSILRSLHLPRPKRFLYFLPLPLGTDLIALTLFVNKISGLYGLLALLTGVSLSPLQLVMYIYSMVVAFLLITWLIPGVTAKKPTESVVFTWLYGVDSVVNAAFTGLFGANWFLDGPGMQMPHSTGSNSPTGIMMRNDSSSALGEEQIPVGLSDSKQPGSTTPGALPAESVASITIIAALWLVRLYFFLVVLAFSRAVVRGEDMENMDTLSRYGGFHSPAFSPRQGIASIESEPGWKGKLGRALVGVNPGYWVVRGVKGGSDWMWLGAVEERGRVRRSVGGSSAGSSRSHSLRRDD